MFYSRNLMVLWFTLMSRTHFEWIFICSSVCGMRFIFWFCVWMSSCSCTICWKDCPFCISFLLTFFITNWPYLCWAVSGLNRSSVDLCTFPFTNIEHPWLLEFWTQIMCDLYFYSSFSTLFWAILDLLPFQINIRLNLSISAEILVRLIGIILIERSGRIYMLTILNLIYHGHTLSLHLFRSVIF